MIDEKSLKDTIEEINRLEAEIRKERQNASTGITYTYPPPTEFHLEYQQGFDLEKELGEQYNTFPQEIKNIISDLENISDSYFVSGNQDRINLATVLKKHIEVIKFNAKLDKITNE